MTIEIDGAHGEGGGQLLRTAVALSAITSRPVRIVNVRARRERPGLAPQHMAAVRAVAAMCEARVDGLAPGSQTVEFVPGRLAGGTHHVDVGTAGSVTLVLQALMPVMIASGKACAVTVTGGTDIRQAPPLDYLAHVLLPLLARAGAKLELETVRRGYYPRGGGEVRLAVTPAPLRPLRLDAPGAPVAVEGLAHVANLPAHIANRMRDAALVRLGALPGCVARIETAILTGNAAIGHGGAVVAWCRTEHTVLGAGRVAEIGKRAETLGDAVGEEIARDVAAGATVDVHAADQLLIYLALCDGGAYLTRTLTTHAETAIWLIERFLPARFETPAAGALVRVAVRSGSA